MRDAATSGMTNACLELCILHLFPSISGTPFRMQVGRVILAVWLKPVCIY